MATTVEKRVELRTTEKQLRAWKRAAEERGLGLSAWIRDTLNAKAYEQQTKAQSANQK